MIAAHTGSRGGSDSAGSHQVSAISSAATRAWRCRDGPSLGPRCRPAPSDWQANSAAIYPRESPGGWQLIGRTSKIAVLWDIDRDPTRRC